MNNLGVMSMGLQCPIIKQGDNIANIAMDVMNYHYTSTPGFYIDNKDVLCITESIVARSQGNYVTVDDIVQFLNEMPHITKNLILYSPIMSRNRFSIILKALARYADKITIVYEGEFDEQGNPNEGINQFTGVNIRDYYKELCEKENCSFLMFDLKNCNLDDGIFLDNGKWHGIGFGQTFIDCHCHPVKSDALTLKDIMCTAVTREDGSVSGFNADFGVLGSNKANDETLKLFPQYCTELCEEIQAKVKNLYDKDIEVLVYGDGCFKDPVGGIWEFADPVTCPGYTKGLEGTPNELKLKALADGKFANLNGEELQDAIKKEIQEKENNLVGNMASQGTTPRRYVDLLASLADLTSGSGDKGTPMVYIKNYFNNYSTK